MDYLDEQDRIAGTRLAPDIVRSQRRSQKWQDYYWGRTLDNPLYAEEEEDEEEVILEDKEGNLKRFFEKPRTLLALSQTCRSFHRLAQPIAFHRFHQVPSNWHTNAFVKFVRTLIERPDLAGKVKELCQHSYEPSGWSNQQDFDMLMAAANRLGMGSVDDPDFESAKEEDVSAGKFCMELLIALLPNLETLHLMFEDQGNYEHTTYTYLQRRLDNLGSGGTLKHLRRVVLDTEEDWGFFFSTPAVGVLHQVAPNLTELVIRHNKGLEIS
ncbi:hypothetical protein N0V84_008050 [Fusarium piperis]|uniref:F-box domain-containing protein n=1 Tax=Fusarium piperis TaxID=1435070 RepID=A0A9W8W8U7_9HYPO|nr:hypothetical protein N0V84_008050 [Fusarium piperis]